MAERLGPVTASDAILVDCLTLFGANLLEAHKEDNARLQSQIGGLCEASNGVRAPSYWSPMRWEAESFPSTLQVADFAIWRERSINA